MKDEVRERAIRLLETLHDLYGHTFDLLGEEAVVKAMLDCERAGIERAVHVVDAIAFLRDYTKISDRIRALATSEEK